MRRRSHPIGTFLASPLILAGLLSLMAFPVMAEGADRTGSRLYCTNGAGNSPRPDYDPCLNAQVDESDRLSAVEDDMLLAEATIADETAVEVEQAEPVVAAEDRAEPWAPVHVDSIGFAFDSAELTPAMRQELDDLAERLHASEGADQLEIVGYTDSTGPAEYNMELSQRRAQAVSDYLADQGIERDRMVVSGRGMNEPQGTNDTLEGRAANRRVATASFR
jgi:outer membrane protein OmpA-like peptidoglycan-associated protein